MDARDGLAARERVVPVATGAAVGAALAEQVVVAVAAEQVVALVAAVEAVLVGVAPERVLADLPVEVIVAGPAVELVVVADHDQPGGLPVLVVGAEAAVDDVGA